MLCIDIPKPFGLAEQRKGCWESPSMQVRNKAANWPRFLFDIERRAVRENNQPRVIGRETGARPLAKSVHESYVPGGLSQLATRRSNRADPADHQEYPESPVGIELLENWDPLSIS